MITFPGKGKFSGIIVLFQGIQIFTAEHFGNHLFRDDEAFMPCFYEVPCMGNAPAGQGNVEMRVEIQLLASRM